MTDGGSNDPFESDLSDQSRSPAPEEVSVTQFSDLQFQHMQHNAVITVGDQGLSDMLHTFEAIQQLPQEEQNTKFIEFKAWAESQKAKACTLTEMSMDTILRDELHLKANVTTKQMKIDNKDTLARVEKTRALRQKAIDRIAQYWKESRKGISFATILFMAYGTKFQNVLIKLAKMADPEAVLEVVNGELIRRMTSPPKPGVRVNMHLTPSEFKNALKILDAKQVNKAFEWDDEKRRELGLRYNMVGMLGEASIDYSEDAPPVGDSVIEFSAVPSPPPNEEVIANLERWARLGVPVVDEDKKPLQECLMDKVVRKLAAPLGSDEEEDVTHPNACKCTAETLESKDWFLTLEEKYVAKQIGWMAMVELVPIMPNDTCNYHLHQLANVLGLKATRVLRNILIHRLNTVYKRRNRIDDVRIHDNYFSWFKPSFEASEVRKSRLLGVLKFQPIKPDAGEPKIVQTPVAGLTVVHQTGVSRPKAGEPELTIAKAQYSNFVDHSVKMYCHHNRYENQGLGFAHHCYYAPWQQACRQDLKLWREATRQRMDQEFRLITVPFPALIIQWDEGYDHTFVHGNARELYSKSDFKLADHLTAYIVHSIAKGKMTSDTEVLHGKVNLSAQGNTTWRNLAATTLGKSNVMFEKGYFHDITPKRKYQGYVNLIACDELVLSRNKSWALVAGGNFTTIQPYENATGDDPFAATIVPYTAIKRKNDGTLEPMLENGMKYQDLKDAHSKLKPIFDKNVTNGGQYEIPGFPVECHLTTENPVEQALVGGLPWNDQSVLNEAAELLALTDEQFNEWYQGTRSAQVQEQYERAFSDVVSKERAYGEKSYYNVAETEPVAGKKRKYVSASKKRKHISADEEGDILDISSDSNIEEDTRPPPQPPQSPRTPSPVSTSRVKKRRRKHSRMDKAINNEDD
ncbi:hypothetical protein BofuT4_P115270.1 [Botrytis cinerea T4]|nr:hypothetical protein BofuT4_P115270.1 [Botrytis cinerea T4]